MKIMTWARKSHALFDYESRTPKKMGIKTNYMGTITRNEETHQIGFVEDD
jgi:hypothetical protein